MCMPTVVHGQPSKDCDLTPHLCSFQGIPTNKFNSQRLKSFGTGGGKANLAG